MIYNLHFCAEINQSDEMDSKKRKWPEVSDLSVCIPLAVTSAIPLKDDQKKLHQ